MFYCKLSSTIHRVDKLKFKCDKLTTVPILNVIYCHSKYDLFLFLVLNANKSLSIVNGYRCAVPYLNSLASRIKSKLYFACFVCWPDLNCKYCYLNYHTVHQTLNRVNLFLDQCT